MTVRPSLRADSRASPSTRPWPCLPARGFPFPAGTDLTAAAEPGCVTCVLILVFGDADRAMRGLSLHGAITGQDIWTDKVFGVVRDRIELSTFRFSGGRSYQLSYLTLATK